MYFHAKKIQNSNSHKLVTIDVNWILRQKIWRSVTVCTVSCWRWNKLKHHMEEMKEEESLGFSFIWDVMLMRNSVPYVDSWGLSRLVIKSGSYSKIKSFFPEEDALMELFKFHFERRGDFWRAQHTYQDWLHFCYNLD